MPELYGNKFKWELREEIHQLSTDLWNERKEHRRTRIQRDFAWCKIEELEAKIKRMAEQAQGILAEADRSIDDAAWERYMPSRKRSVA